MTQVPNYQSPPPGDARAKVNAPAIGLMVVGGIGIALNIVAVLLNILGVGLNAAGGGEGATSGMLQGTLGIVVSIIAIAVSVVVLMGAMKMRNLQSYGFAMAAAVLAMIPYIGPCCCIGIPIGIWAIIVLVKPEVKAAFTA